MLTKNLILSFLMVLTCTSFITMSNGWSEGRHPVVPKSEVGTPLENTAKQLSSDELDYAAQHNDHPSVLIATSHLSPRHRHLALFVQLQSPNMCGSAGCATSIYIKQNNKWQNILDSVNGYITILPTSHRGFYDLEIDNNDKWIWNGESYQDSGAP